MKPQESPTPKAADSLPSPTPVDPSQSPGVTLRVVRILDDDELARMGVFLRLPWNQICQPGEEIPDGR